MPSAHETVEHHAPDRDAARVGKAAEQQLPIVLDGPVAEPERDRVDRERLRAVRRGHDRDPEREAQEHHAEDQAGMGQERQEGAVFDHQY